MGHVCCTNVREGQMTTLSNDTGKEKAMVKKVNSAIKPNSSEFSINVVQQIRIHKSLGKGRSVHKEQQLEPFSRARANVYQENAKLPAKKFDLRSTSACGKELVHEVPSFLPHDSKLAKRPSALNVGKLGSKR